VIAVYRILSIDGGGVRGLVPALVLAELEERTGRHVADLFDLVAGTSAGAILALGLLRPGADGRPRWRARDLVDFYEVAGPAIFARTPWRVVRTVDGLLAPRYDARPLERLLRERLGDDTLGDALREVIVTSYDIRGREPYLFTSADVRARTAADQPMWTVARASSAPPTYFAPVRMRRDDGTGDRWLVDGGVYANNPAMCAYAHVRRHRQDTEVGLVSVGTGELSTDFATARIRRGGALVWARPLFDIVLDGQENVTDHQLRELLPAGRYFRFQAGLDTRSERIDDGSPRNLRALRDQATRLIARSAASLDAAAAMLTTTREEAPR
jgi:patatin-like phospholipase/acyl hydrolase